MALERKVGAFNIGTGGVGSTIPVTGMVSAEGCHILVVGQSIGTDRSHHMRPGDSIVISYSSAPTIKRFGVSMG